MLDCSMLPAATSCSKASQATAALTCCCNLTPFKRHKHAIRATAETGRATSSTETQLSQSPGAGVLQRAVRNAPNWSSFLGALALTGAVEGTLLDGIHSRVALQVYDLAPVTAGPLATSWLVPPLLATFYVVLGLLTCITDNLSSDSPETTAAVQRASSNENAVPYIAACFGNLAVNLFISASLFDAKVVPKYLFPVLAGLAVLNWGVFDRTKQGLGLAVLCGVGAPAAELILMNLTGCWHYTRPDVAGLFVSWVPLCYAFYVPAVSNLSRFLWRNCRRDAA